MYGSYESACNATVTRAQVERELERHGFTLAEFLKDNPDRPLYNGGAVLDWMGY